MKTEKALPELLAPAGSREAAIAAVKAGADAIYLGGTMLNARMNARNFSDDQLWETVSYCHENGVSVYVTLNTAVYDRELDEALRYVGFLYVSGVDALIVADLGLASLIREYYPGFELHASTQASGHSVACAVALSGLGFSRMVCAREMSKTEIDSLCAESPIEIEQFVHGALCVSQSGQCLASAMIGGRSGNRGACAQPCRMQYNGGYPLSLKDAALARYIPEIIDSGVASLKIEGRMKSPAYVGGVVRIYRRLLDERRAATDAEMRELAALFSRGGFTDGYYTEKIDDGMNGIRSEQDKADTARVQNAPPVNQSPGIYRAKAPIIHTRERAVNPDAAYKAARGSVPKKPQKPILTARFSRPDQIPRSNGFSIVYLPLDSFRIGSGANGVVLPPTIFSRDLERAESFLAMASAAGAEHALVCNIGHVALAEKYGFTVHGDYRLNVFNTEAAKLYGSMGMRDIILAPELTLPQMRDITAPKAAIVYGRIPLMLLTKPVGAKALRDRTGASFPVIREFGYDEMLNCVPVWMADRARELDSYGIRGRHFFFTTESRRECESVIRAYESGLAPDRAVRRIQK